jgi:hypothetical protein
MDRTITLDDHGVYVVVSGAPGSGKSTLARALAPRLRLPLFAKDTIKEALMGTLEVSDVAASRDLGRACVQALLAVAEESGSGVLDSVWQRSLARESLRDLPGQIVEVFCRCDADLARTRYLDRAESRAAGHFDSERDPAELWNDETCEPVDGGWPVIEVDTTTDVDLDELLDRLANAGDSPVDAAGWVVWCQDDAGNRVEVTRRDSQDVARAVADAMEATGSAGSHTFLVTASTS